MAIIYASKDRENYESGWAEARIQEDAAIMEYWEGNIPSWYDDTVILMTPKQRFVIKELSVLITRLRDMHNYSFDSEDEVVTAALHHNNFVKAVKIKRLSTNPLFYRLP